MALRVGTPRVCLVSTSASGPSASPVEVPRWAAELQRDVGSKVGLGPAVALLVAGGTFVGFLHRDSNARLDALASEVRHTFTEVRQMLAAMSRTMEEIKISQAVLAEKVSALANNMTAGITNSGDKQENEAKSKPKSC